MATYRYWATNLLSGKIVADNIPLTVQSFSRQLGTAGQLTGTLSLQSGNAAQNRVYLSALEPRRSVLWVSQDNVPVWAGIVWDWPHQTILDGNLPITAATLESLFQKRQIDANQLLSGDVFDLVRTLITFATNKTPNGQVAGLTLPTTKAGVNYAVTYLATDLAKVWDAVTGIATAANFEITFTPAADASGNGLHLLQVGLPRIGVPLSQSSVEFKFPGNLLDYGFARTGSSSANSLIATAPPNGSAASWHSAYPHGQDTADLAAGYPLLEDTVSFAGVVGVTSQAQIDGYADGKLPMRTGAQETPFVQVAPGQHPPIREINLGDWCTFIATSPLHPAQPNGAPGLQTSARIIGWTVTPPGAGQNEMIRINLGSLTLH